MIIQILTEDDAKKRLEDADWRNSWTNLYQSCSWATSMQDLPFVESWYNAYENKYSPVFVVGYNNENELVGLLTLAIEQNTNRLVVAGDNMCEYGTWLSPDAVAGNQFIGEALTELEKAFPNAELEFLYLAAGTPLDWLAENKKWRDRCELRKEIRPLLRFDDDAEIQASLKKKGNRSRLNQMKKRGEVRLETITDLSQFEAIFDTVKNFGDLRLSAVHRFVPDNSTAAEKKKFYLELFKANLLLVTLLKIGDEIASAHFDLKNGNSYLLGMTALSPFFSKYSPSKFHIPLLCLELLKQNVNYYDLSPGGSYKDRHSNANDEVHVLKIYFNERARRKSAVKRQVALFGKNVLAWANIDRETLDQRIYETRYKLKFLSPKKVIETAAAKVRGGANKQECEMRVYTFDVEKTTRIPNPALMNRNQIEDLLKYEPTESWHSTPSDFHQMVIERLSEGFHVYTKVEDGVLVHCGWMRERQEEILIAEVNQRLMAEPDSAVLFDFFTHPRARGKGLYQAALKQILHDTARIPNTRQSYIAVKADNTASRHSIEKVGFEYKCSLHGNRN